jgi:hypothetical protein
MQERGIGSVELRGHGSHSKGTASRWQQQRAPSKGSETEGNALFLGLKMFNTGRI